MRIAHRLGWLMLLAALAVIPAGPRAPAFADSPKPASELATKVLAYAKAQAGKQIGDGECSTFAIEALKAAGGKTTVDYGVVGLDKDYVWGTAVEKVDAVRPGDLVQMRDVKMVEKVVVNGKTVTRTSRAKHHTAIVAEVLGKGKIKILHQNSGGNRTVRETEFDVGALTEGKVWFYRPEEK